MAQSGMTEEEKTTSPSVYDKIADEAMKIAGEGGPTKEDQNAIMARIVEKLKTKNPLPEGASEEPLWEMARRMYWDWEDAQRKKTKSGQEELLANEPMEV